jgi:hypothetical protein
MKEVENVTGNMGEGEAMTAAEEAARVDEAKSADDAVAANGDTVVEVTLSRPDEVGSPLREVNPDPWQAFVQIGAQLVAALSAADGSGAPAHPWIERDPATGVQHLRMPLPPPETARQLATALSVLADSLRGTAARATS